MNADSTTRSAAGSGPEHALNRLRAAAVAVICIPALTYGAAMPAAQAEPIPAGCFQSAVLNPTTCANYFYTGDAGYADYGFRCGHDVDLNADDCGRADGLAALTAARDGGGAGHCNPAEGLDPVGFGNDARLGRASLPAGF
jgi:hypothetical protein